MTPTPTLDPARAARHAAQAMYLADFATCPRSVAWKSGARAGVLKAHGVLPPASPWANATAEDDAWRAGFQQGLREARAAVAERSKAPA